MSFELVKVLRVRPANPLSDERLSMFTNGRFKGGMSDVRVELWESNREYQVKWIPISTVEQESSTEYKKREFENFGSESKNRVIDKEISYRAKMKIYLSGKNLDSDKYYKIIQDPWLDEPPIQRNFGFDPYYLNNGTEVLISWFESNGTTIAGGIEWSSNDGKELKVKSGGTYSLVTQAGITYPKYDETEKTSLIKKVEFRNNTENFVISDGQIKKMSSDLIDQSFSGNVLDSDIIDRVIFLWTKNVPNYELKLCEPSYYPTITLEYITPLGLTPETKPNNDNKSPSTDNVENRKIKLSPVWDTNLKIKAGTDLPKIDIYFGEPRKDPEFNFSDEDEFDDLRLLDDEFVDNEFGGLSEDVINVQEENVNNQQDSISNETSGSSLESISETIKTNPVTDERSLYDLAGKVARQLGKNQRVNSENMRKSYDKNIHGLCPQGTQAMIVALTGIVGLGKIGGNADWFSFKTPGTGNGNASFNKSIGGVVYYNDKIKIEQINGSWKNTFLDSGSKSKWQVGDIIAMGYKNGKKYGHIQCWTGTTWQSDFRQGNSIQQNSVDPNTVALWRLNQNGIDAVNKQIKSLNT